MPNPEREAKRAPRAVFSSGVQRRSRPSFGRVTYAQLRSGQIEVEGRKVTFDIAAKDNLEPISAGSHSRFVVDKGKTVERLKAKAAKAGTR